MLGKLDFVADYGGRSLNSRIRSHPGECPEP